MPLISARHDIDVALTTKSQDVSLGLQSPADAGAVPFEQVGFAPGGAV